MQTDLSAHLLGNVLINYVIPIQENSLWALKKGKVDLYAFTWYKGYTVAEKSSYLIVHTVCLYKYKIPLYL